MRIHVKAPQGIGDNLYARPFVKLLAAQRDNDVYVETNLPHLISDLNVKFIRPQVSHRTQAKELAYAQALGIEFTYPKFDTFDTYVPKFERTIDYHYNYVDLKAHGHVSSIEKRFGFEPGSTYPVFDLPSLPDHYLQLPTDKKIAVVRPVTHRNEFHCTSRSPNPHYVNWCARVLRSSGYYVISIADVEIGSEWMEGDEPPADMKFHRGELGILGVLSLLQRADIVIGGAGFIVPAAVCAGANLFLILGGRGQYDTPSKLFDLRMDMKKIGWAMPDNFCRCDQMTHECDNTISDLDNQFMTFMSRIA